MINTFTENLKWGQVGESMIAKWFMALGYIVSPVYEKEKRDGAGPAIFSTDGAFVAPDMLVCKKERAFWIEAKTKTAFTWYRKKGLYQDGIDCRHWRDYQQIAARSPFAVWLLFLHGPGGIAKDNPTGKVPPIGLFGNSLDALVRTIDHESDKHGKSGMVYWNVANVRSNEPCPLTRIATWDAVAQACSVECSRA